MKNLNMAELTHCLNYLKNLNSESGIAQTMLDKLPQFITDMDTTLNDAHEQITYLTNMVAKLRKVAPHQLETSTVTKRQIDKLRERLYVSREIPQRSRAS